MSIILAIFLSILIISLISVVGILFLAVKKDLLDKILNSLVAFASGGLLGGAFLHLLPESIEKGNKNAFFFVLIGMMLFFVLEKFLFWRHCHEGEHCEVHSFAYMSIFGDAIHNFLDGLIIAAAYMTDFHLGVVTTFAVILHEIPQEIGDFGILVFGGIERIKAILFNFLSALTAFIGAAIGIFLGNIGELEILILPIAAGGFIYIASTDLIPQFHKEMAAKKSIAQFLLISSGIMTMYVMRIIFEG